MERRNFLSGLMAAPLALKARLVRFFAGKQGLVLIDSRRSRRYRSLTSRQREIVELLAKGSAKQPKARMYAQRPGLEAVAASRGDKRRHQRESILEEIDARWPPERDRS